MWRYWSGSYETKPALLIPFKSNSYLRIPSLISDSEPDKEDLRLALSLVSASAAHNNEAIRRRENQEKILEIQMSFVEGTSLNLLENPGRSFVKSGTMTKLSR